MKIALLALFIVIIVGCSSSPPAPATFSPAVTAKSSNSIQKDIATTFQKMDNAAAEMKKQAGTIEQSKAADPLIAELSKAADDLDRAILANDGPAIKAARNRVKAATKKLEELDKKLSGKIYEQRMKGSLNLPARGVGGYPFGDAPQYEFDPWMAFLAHRYVPIQPAKPAVKNPLPELRKGAVIVSPEMPFGHVLKFGPNVYLGKVNGQWIWLKRPSHLPAFPYPALTGGNFYT